MTALRAEGCGRLSAAGYVRFRSGGDSPNGLRVVVAASPQFLKSALRDLLSVSYGMIGILQIGSLRSPPPFRLRRTSPYSGGRINRSMLSCRDMAPWLSIHSPTTKWGKGGGASHQRGMHFRRPQGGCTVFAAKGGIRNGARKRRTSPAQRYYITPEGESPQPACKAKPITGRTLAAQGRMARRLAQPSRP